MASDHGLVAATTCLAESLLPMSDPHVLSLGGDRRVVDRLVRSHPHARFTLVETSAEQHHGVVMAYAGDSRVEVVLAPGSDLAWVAAQPYFADVVLSVFATEAHDSTSHPSVFCALAGCLHQRGGSLLLVEETLPDAARRPLCDFLLSDARRGPRGPSGRREAWTRELLVDAGLKCVRPYWRLHNHVGWVASFT